ncbi:MAG: PA domain-containing protein, partial [Solirubrobacteraceae bacterium]
MRGSYAGATFVAVLALVALSAQGAFAAPRSSPFAMEPDGGAGPAGGASALPPLTAGLPPTEKNVELVGRLQLAGGRFPDVKPGQIADLSHKGDYAYLNSWQSESESRCNRGGVFIVDIKDPANPKEVGFVASPTGTYSGEGSQVISLDTPQFKGDLLTINNEACVDPDATPDTLKGGITLVDVTNPLAPVVLAEGFGDTTPSAAVPGVRNSPVHLVHSAFSWQSGQKAYTVMVDNEEIPDVDIVDITNPRAPQVINELDLLDPATIAGGVISGSAFGDGVFLHDMVVKQIGGRQIMLASYWDGGYVQLDVTDPTSVRYVSDSNFGSFDPLFSAFTPPEGNAHEAEFSHDNRYILAADEDFAPFRGRLTNAAGAGFNFAEPTDAVARIADLPGGTLASESVTFVGRACWSTGTPAPDTIAPAPAPADADPATLRVAVIERGLCSFDEKVQGAATAGYEAFVIFNDADRPDGDPLMTNAVIDSPDFDGRGVLPGGYLTRADALA